MMMRLKPLINIAHLTLLVACCLVASSSGVLVDAAVTGDEQPSSGAAFGLDADFASMSPAFVASVQSLVESKQAAAFLPEGTRNYTRIAIPANRNAKFFYVAAPNTIYRVSLETLELESKISWSHSADKPMLRECNVGGTSKQDCTTNRIFALLISKGNLLVCGTVIGRPTCSLRLVMQPDHSLGSFDVQLRDADSQSQKAIALDDRDVFIGAHLRQNTDPALFRSSLSSRPNPVRTSRETQQSRALKPIYQPATFISVHVVGAYAYYFFQENFEEMTTCGARSQRIISRVARVCKSDPGYRENNWLSFAKSRLVCAHGGNWVRTDGSDDESKAFYYDLLQDTYETDTHIYGLFTAAQSGIKASAICGFPFTTFNKVFGDQTVKTKRWDSRETDVPFAFFIDVQDRYNRSDCALLEMKSEEIATYTNNNRHSFIKSARVIQDTNEPVASASENWLRLIVDKVPSSQPGQYHKVAFVLTESQSIKKILLASGTRCVLEEIQLDRSLDGRINDMKLAPSSDYLVVTTDSRVLRLPTSRCGRHALRTTCLAARDPYCGWNKRQFACSNRPANTNEWEQDITPQLGQVCADRSVPVDGGWSDWRPWQRCQAPRGSPGTGSCTCRFRLCDNPKPHNGGRPCGKFHDLEVENQVVNCSVDGGWSPWEAWSACPSCDRKRSATRERSRTCTQPRPNHGGVQCIGADLDGRQTETAPCDAPDCKDVHVAVNGTWSTWTDWSPCSRPCGSGITERTRYCNEAVNGGFPCVGDSREWRSCNTSPCLAARKMQQTGWMPTGKSKASSGRQVWLLVEATCRAYETDSGEYRVELRVDNRTQVCDSPSDCTSQDSGSLAVNGNWGQWGAWSGCSTTCGMGYRERKRECDNPPASPTGAFCVGDAKQIEACAHLQACKLPEWADWSCWSDCQNPNGHDKGCGTGKQSRLRACLNSKGGRAGCISGPFVQERECSLDPCDYFTEWSAWSPCRSRLRNRTRKCLLPPTSALMAVHCRGNLYQTEECAAPPGPMETSPVQVSERPSLEATSLKSPESEVTLAGVIGAAWLLSLVLVSGATFGIACCYYRRRISNYKADMKGMQKQVDLLRSGTLQQQQQQQQQQPLLSQQQQQPLLQQPMLLQGQVSRNDLDLPGYNSMRTRVVAVAPVQQHFSENQDTCSINNEPSIALQPDENLMASGVFDKLQPSSSSRMTRRPAQIHLPGSSRSGQQAGLHRSHSTSESTRQPYHYHYQRHQQYHPDGTGTSQRRPRFDMPPQGDPNYNSYDRVLMHQQHQLQPNVYVTQRSQPQPLDYQHQPMPMPERVRLPPQSPHGEDNSYESSSLMRHYRQHRDVEYQHQHSQPQPSTRFQYPVDTFFATVPSSRSAGGRPEPRPHPQTTHHKVSSGSQTDNSFQPPDSPNEMASHGLLRQHSEHQRQQHPRQQHPHQRRHHQPSSTEFSQSVQQSYSDFQRFLQRDQSA